MNFSLKHDLVPRVLSYPPYGWERTLETRLSQTRIRSDRGGVGGPSPLDPPLNPPLDHHCNPALGEKVSFLEMRVSSREVVEIL